MNWAPCSRSSAARSGVMVSLTPLNLVILDQVRQEGAQLRHLGGWRLTAVAPGDRAAFVDDREEEAVGDSLRLLDRLHVREVGGGGQAAQLGELAGRQLEAGRRVAL